MSRKQIATDRRRDILAYIKVGDSVKIDDIAQHYNCSPHTIRNDLSYLRELGIEVKSKNGYIAVGDPKRVNLIRQIKFPATYKEAGISILAYFSKILQEKCPNSDAEVIISQQGDVVKLIIESDKGQLQTIEKTLSDYGDVVKGEITPSDFLSDNIAALELSNKLELARTELKLKEQTFHLINENQAHRITSLETQVSELRNFLGTQLHTINSLSQAILVSTNRSDFNPSVDTMIKTISKLAEEKHTPNNESKLIDSLEELKKVDPGTYAAVVKNIKSFASSIAANIATPWIVNIINALPK